MSGRHRRCASCAATRRPGPEWHGAGAPELFDTNLLCVAHCGTDAAFGSLGAPENVYASWKSIDPLTEAEFERRYGVAPEGQARLIGGLLDPRVLLDILRDYVVFQPEGGRLVKKLPRYQQYRAVTNAMERILGGRTPQERGGVVWHTQGSGKSLTMLWLATKLRRSPALRNPTIVVVTDRTQLDRQITTTFRSGSASDEPERAVTTKRLRALLTTNIGRTVMTTIQKFEEVLSAPAGDLGDLTGADNVVVMVDEAHRTQYGRLAAKMRAALPNATFVGFTGTPIDRGIQAQHARRIRRPHRLLHHPAVRRGRRDRADPLRGAPPRAPRRRPGNPRPPLRRAVWRRAGRDEGRDPASLRQQGTDRRGCEAHRGDRARHLRALQGEDPAEWIQGAGRRGEPRSGAALRRAPRLLRAPRLPGHHDHQQRRPEFQVAKDLNEDEIVGAFTDPDGEPQILVVVDKLITGFDAPIEQALYLDRSIREHTLLQAIARVNRPYSRTEDGVTTEKTYGLIVDYNGVSRELEAALAIFDHGDVEEALRALPEDPGPALLAAADRAESHFRGLDLDDAWACIHRFAADRGTEGDFKADAYELFDRDYREFSTLMDRFLPDRAALDYLDRLARLTGIRSLVRAQFLRERADIDWTAVGAKVKQLLDSRIDATVRELMKPVSILDQDFEQKIERLPHDEARASVMEHALRAQINERIDENPAFYERLSEVLERIIRELRARLISAAEASKQMGVVRDEINREQDIASAYGLTPVSFAVYGVLAGDTSNGAESEGGLAEEQGTYRVNFDEGLGDVARDIEVELDQVRSIVDWHENLDVQRELRRDLKRRLRDTRRYTEDDLDELVRQVVEVARRRIA